MAVLVVGLAFVIWGILSMQFPQLVVALRDREPDKWRILGSPMAFSFSKAIGVFSWVLERRFEECDDPAVYGQGKAAYKQALLAKKLLLAGVALIMTGFFLQLIFISY